MAKPKKFLKPLPHLPVKNLRATLDYYQDQLGFTDEWTFGDKDGGIRRDNLRLLFGEDDAFTKNINSENRRLAVMWFVDNIEEIYREFKERGILIVEDLSLHPHGLREFAFTDINGYYIRVAEEPEEE